MAGSLSKILYVEDDPIIAELAGMVLTTFGGFDVQHCASGAESVPAVFMTARVQVHERESYMQLGAVGVIPKPFDPMTLSDQIAEMWRLSSAAACQDS